MEQDVERGIKEKYKSNFNNILKGFNRNGNKIGECLR